MTGRKSLRARNAQAIRSSTKDDGDEAAPVGAAEQSSEPGEDMPSRQSGGTLGQVIQGIYFRAGIFNAAKAAYVRDFYDLPDSPDTIAGWVARCIEKHCDRTAEERQRILDGIPTGGARGDTRTFKIPAATQQRMHDTINADGRASGQVSSASEFAGAAVVAATDAARERAGGELPPAQRRLPNRLVR